MTMPPDREGKYLAFEDVDANESDVASDDENSSQSSDRSILCKRTHERMVKMGRYFCPGWKSSG